MFARLRKLLQAPAPVRPADLRMAVAVLLVEAAQRDDRFADEERAVIVQMLGARFDLAGAECTELLEVTAARRSGSAPLDPHTHTIDRKMAMAERIALIEMLWEVAYADGVLDPQEDALIRGVAALIDVPDSDRLLARRRVLDRHGDRDGVRGS